MPRQYSCQWRYVQNQEPENFNNFYVASQLLVDGSPVPFPDSASIGIWINPGTAISEAFQLTSTHSAAIAAFIQQSLERKCGMVVFQIPRGSGYIRHADPWASRVADSAIVTSTKSFLSPLQKVVAVDCSAADIDCVSKALNNAAGVIATEASLCDESIKQLGEELKRRLSLPLLSTHPIQPRRVLFITWSRTSAHRASWANALALGLKVVVASSGPWSPEDPSLQKLNLDGYIELDMTLDAGFSQRIVAAVRDYPDHIDGLCGPWDEYMVPVAKAAQELGLFTNGPEPFSISTSKYLTRRTLDPEGKDYFTVKSIQELDAQLESDRQVSYPVVCKPVAGTSSSGVFRADTSSQLREAVRKTLLYSQHTTNPSVLIEPYINGPEVDCNIVLLNGRVLYTEVVDDFPCSGDLSDDATSALFIETQVAVPSRLPESEQKLISESVVAVVRQQGFTTGVFHCEARIRNSSMSYVFGKGATIPDLEPMSDPPRGQPLVYLHEVNARMPGPMSSASTLIARGLDFFGLSLLCSVGAWSTFEALSTPFSRDELCDHTWLINCLVPVSLPKIAPLFPGHSTGDLSHEAVDSKFSPILALAKTNPDLTTYVMRHHVYIEPASKLGGKEGDWLWTTCMVIRSPICRQDARRVAQELPAIYEAFVKQTYGSCAGAAVQLRSHYV
ncbi:Carnosine synthase 1 [Beauveria bassiana]|uniref:Carnosine synthase 1 n=1 Tax=Beauveria bassiana TaxID=176275 RepID=A0A2N6NU81_BEABA|nr:Carnosine synthase 1 [Beauveria bassiana]